MTVFEKLKSCENVEEMVAVLYFCHLNKGIKWLTRLLESEWVEK